MVTLPGRFPYLLYGWQFKSVAKIPADELTYLQINRPLAGPSRKSMSSESSGGVSKTAGF